LSREIENKPINSLREVDFHSVRNLSESDRRHERKISVQRRHTFSTNRIDRKKRLALRQLHGTLLPQFPFSCGHSLMVKLQPSKLAMRVRSSLPAPCFKIKYLRFFLQNPALTIV